jgi:hypothetical protein
MGGKSSAPPAPDYTAAANATAAGNEKAAQDAINANRINQYTPYGNLTYSHSGTDPNLGWSQTVNLSPAQQGILDSTNSLNQGLLNTAGSGLNYANNVLSHPGVDTNSLPSTGFNPGQSYQNAYMTRLQPQIDAQNRQFDAQMANQGIAPGTQAYQTAKQSLYDQQNNLLANITTQGFNTGLAANQQGFQQQAYNQMQPINVINALRTGSQVQNPTFNQVPQQATTQGADLLGAAGMTGQYNMNAAQMNNNGFNSFLGGLTNLGSAAILAGSKGSDVRLKHDIEYVGESSGHSIYTFRYNAEPSAKYVGVMAQEVMKSRPDAVEMGDDGFMRVDYAKIGVPFLEVSRG